jgi:hypothetical protein
MNALAFIDRYKAIRKQYYSPTKGLVPPIEAAPKYRVKFVYLAPIGPIRPVLYNPKSISQGMAFAQEIIESGKILQVPRNRGTVILREVSEQYGVSIEDIISPRRDAKYVRPRQIVMYRMCKETDWSLPRIGRLLGNRDHTTVIHARNKIEALIAAGEVTL